MSILNSLSRLFLAVVFILATNNIANINAMNSYMVGEDLSISKISENLIQNKEKPKAVLNLIDQLFIDHGHHTSVKTLKMALDNANMWIGSIDKYNRKQNCLYHCLSQDLVKIIFSVAGDRAWDLISMSTDNSWTAWHNAIFYGRKNIVNNLINWAIDHNRLRDLLSLKCCPNNNLKPLDVADDLIIFKTLIKLSDTIPGLLKDWLLSKDRIGQTSLKKTMEDAKKFEIAKSYIEKYQLT